MQYNELFNYLLESDNDLLDSLEFINEFEADGQPADTENEEDEDFTMDDEQEDNVQEEPEDNPPQEDDAPAEDAPDDQEFDMGNVGEDETQDEAEPDVQNDTTEPEETPENAEDDPEDNQEDTPAEEEPAEDDENFELPDDAEGEENPDGAPPEDGGDEDFNMDGEDAGGDGEADMDNEPSMEDQGTIDTKLKDLESVIFDDLSENEKKMKIRELKDLFIYVYKKCDSILDIINEVRQDEETIQIVEYISNTLIDLKHYVNDYITDVFDYKTYVENLSQLQKYIMIFNAINKVFDQIKRENNE